MVIDRNGVARLFRVGGKTKSVAIDLIAALRHLEYPFVDPNATGNWRLLKNDFEDNALRCLAHHANSRPVLFVEDLDLLGSVELLYLFREGLDFLIDSFKRRFDGAGLEGDDATEIDSWESHECDPGDSESYIGMLGLIELT